MAYSTISKSSLYFNTVLYTGNGGTKNVTGVGFQPDFCWMKVRDGTSSHALFDVLRGVQKRLVSNDTAGQLTQSGLTSFDTDGFTLGSQGAINGNGGNHVAWNWKANGAGSSNSSGSVSATVSANTTAGFSISTFTTPASGTFTVGHGLGIAPKFIIYRPITSSGWQIGHDSIGWTKAVFFDTQSQQTSTAFGNTAPTTTLWTGNSANVGGNASCFAYCFAEVPGYSKIGSYVGNGNADGTFVYTGFKPQFIIQKPVNTTQNWQIHDTKRPGYNVKNYNLSANNSNAEADNEFIDILSNGFKNRTSGVLNVAGNTHIYIAFAEEPLVANVGAGIPATAR